MHFKFKAIGVAGKITSGSVEASNLNQAARELTAGGFALLELKEARSLGTGDRGRSILPGFRAWKEVDQAQLFSDLALLTGVGLTVSKALDTLQKAGPVTPQGIASGAIFAAMATGSSAAVAFEGLKGIKGETLAMIASGEHSGNLTKVFSALALQLQQRAKDKTAALNALAYPFFLICLTLLALIVVVFVLVPAIEPAFDNTGKVPPAAIRLFSWFRHAITVGTPAIGLLGCAFVAAITIRRSRVAFLRGWASFVAAAPFLGAFIREQQLARYLNSLSMLLENGIVLSRSLDIASTSVTLPELAGKLQAAKELVTGGARLPAAFEKLCLFDMRILAVLTVGFEASKLGLAAGQAAAMLEERTRRTVDRFVAILTPALTIFLGFAIGGLILSVMTALLSVNEIAIQ